MGRSVFNFLSSYFLQQEAYCYYVEYLIFFKFTNLLQVPAIERIFNKSLKLKTYYKTIFENKKKTENQKQF